MTRLEVRLLIRHWQARHSLRETARETTLDRKTVRRYVEVLKALELGRELEVDEALVQRVAALVQTRLASEPSTERLLLLEHRDRIEAWLTKREPLPLTKVHLLLERSYGVNVSYATLRRFALDELDWRTRRPRSNRAPRL